MTVRILQEHLAQIANAMLSGDFDRFACCMSMPLEVSTRRAHLWVEDLDMLEDGFEAYSDSLMSMGVDGFDQRAISITAVTNRCIHGRSASCWTRRDDMVVPMTSTGVTLEWHDRHWKASHFVLASEDTRWPLMPHKMLVM